MKKLLLFIFGILISSYSFSQQYFSDNFDSYALNDFVGLSSPQWTTWSNTPGSVEDAKVVDTKAFSGTHSIYFESALGNGPQDVVLNFGKVHTSGRYKFTTKLFVPTGKAAYFNFQGGANVGITWALEFYMRAGGTYDMSVGTLTGAYPQNKWFEVTFDMDLDKGVWEFFIDGVSQGTINNTNNVSFLDVFTADANSEFWMDDISFCTNNACNPEISMESVTISPNSICQREGADVIVKIKNNSTFSAEEMTLAIDVGVDRTTQLIKLNFLAGGKDTTFTVPNMFKSNIAGNGVAVDAVNLQSDINPANDTTKTTVTVKPSPNGVSLVKGTPFTTPRPGTNGTTTDPDIVAPQDVITYEVTAPTGFVNSAYGTTWDIKGITLRTSSGSVLASSYYTFTAPSGTANAKISFTPDTLICDSALSISFVVVDISNLCETSISRYMYVAPKPVASFSAVDVCDKKDMAFSNASSLKSGIMSNTWFFGDLTGSTLTDPIKRYGMAGKYDVKLIVSSPFGYKDSMIKQVEVYPIPQSDFDFTNACEGTPILFTDKSVLPTGTPTYDWDFGTSPVSGSTTANPTKLYNKGGSYSVNLKVTVNGCSSSLTKLVTQQPRVTPDFTFTNTKCDNLVIPFTNTTIPSTSGTVGYVWRFGDGAQAAQVSPQHAYNVFQVFDVTLVATTDFGCVDSISKQVTLLESPKPVFTPIGQTCTNGDIVFTNTTNIPAGSTNVYDWSFGDGNISTSADPTNIFVSPGTYKVVLKALSTNGCEGESESTIIINEKPEAEFVANSVCLGKETKFSNGSTISVGTLTYTWDLDDGNPTTTVTNPTTTFATAKTYNVKLVSESAAGCSDTIVKAVEAYLIPTVDINIASNQTQDGTMLFSTSITGTGYTYFWTFGDGGNSSQQNPSYKYNFQGTWPVTLTIRTGNGCENSLSTSVFVNPLSVADITSNNWLVYPNPSTGKFFIKHEGAEIATITISDILGKTITSLAPELSSNELAFDLSNQKAGVYIVTLIDVDGNRSTQKITLSK